MRQKKFAQTIALLLYEILILLTLVALIRWLTGLHAAPVVRGVVFLTAMALFIPPLMYAIYRPYRVPAWLAGVQSQGQPSRAEVLENKHIGSFWRPQDMGRYVQIRVRVLPEDAAPFEGWLTCRLDDAQDLPAGKQVEVRCDPHNPDWLALTASE